MPALSVALFFIFWLGCVSPRQEAPAAARSFDFATDTLSYSNELSWEYFFDENGKWNHVRREVRPTYKLRCFVVVHAAKQFYKHARFEPTSPIVDDLTYRERIREIVHGGDRRPAQLKIVIPGYANLREFSVDREQLLKEECGGAWRSYFQRGNWRMILPFSRRHHESASEKLKNSLQNHGVAAVHLVRFPQLTINHAVLLTGFEETENKIQFSVYDPNQPNEERFLDYDRRKRTFWFPANNYFFGGKVNVYEIYHSPFY